MGYRLEISKLDYAACGGKLYGYIDDETLEKLKSYKWLLDKGYIDGNEMWTYCCGPKPIVLSPGEFKEFIDLYIEDKRKIRPTEQFEKEFVPDLQKLKDGKTFILLEWG